MSIDFSKLSAGSVADTAIEPSQIFAALPNNRYPYLRDVQGQVLDRWYGRRDERDILIKMNTGAGKTVVGLLILKSYLNAGIRPAVYLAADPYLAEQVVAEGSRLGIEATTDPESQRFTAGRAILVTSVYRLINGRSVFGVGSRPHRAVGPVLIDDAHACSAVAEDQFSIRLAHNHEGWTRLFDTFEEDLRKQAAATSLAIKDGDPRQLLELPFWAWQEKQQQATAILHAFRDEDEFGFHWPLIMDILPGCRVIFTGTEVQIVPPCLPIAVLPSFSRASRRIYMTATLPDDGVLIEDFGAEPELVLHPVTPRTAGDLGDRMIVAPQETHPEVGESELRDLVAGFAKSINVVVIVPSSRRAEVWKRHASLVLSKDNLREGLSRLTSEHVGLTVLLNRYDGVDLPGAACRMLVIDGVPEAYTPLERLEAAVVSEGESMTRRQVQRIEQGMGRGVRANDDFCVVVLLGSKLAQHIHSPGGKDVFSPGTRAQMELSFRLTEQLQGQPLSLLETAFTQCLERNEGWVTASRNAVVGVSYPAGGTVTELTIRRRRAFDLALRGEHRDAALQLQEVASTVSDVRLRGWVKQEAASHLQPVDKVNAQQLQRSAVEDNPALSRPLQGITYQRLSEPSMNQARLCSIYLTTTYPDANSLLLGVEAILGSLEFGPDSAADFEAAMRDLGLHLGFGAQRPEHESGAGPDVLWALGQLRYLVIECKSEAVEDVPKRDAAQIGNAIDWFKSKYDPTCKVTPILVHPTGKLRRQVVLPASASVITTERLQRLREAVRAFAVAVASEQRYRRADEIVQYLSAHQLVGEAFRHSYSGPAEQG